MKNDQAHFIDVVQLRVGLYVHLDLGWMDHPFASSNFKISNEEQIVKIKKLGLKKLRYDPNRSDFEPLVIPNTAPEVIKDIGDSPEPIAVTSKPISKKERLRLLNQVIVESEVKFILASNVAREVSRKILTTPTEAISQASNMINGMVETVLVEGDVAIQALNGNLSDDRNYQHSLNVTVLALMLAKSIDISKDDVRLLGMAALFHDIGKSEVPDVILMKKEPLTKLEQSYLEQHSEIGARIAKQVGLPDRVAKVILQHHEFADGSGYPNHLGLEQIDILARLVSLVNSYDNLCNPINPALAKTPYEALAYMFANQRSKFDDPLLNRMIKLLGVYPPGSIVQLSTGTHAIVISANPNKPLRPFVMLHDPLTDRNEPQIMDLREEPNININICLRPSQLAADVLSYLNPRRKISYFMNGKLLNENKP